MKKTSIYLEPELDRALSRLAAHEGMSKAEIIRRAVAEKVREAPGAPRITAIGVIEGPGDVSEQVNRHLEGLGED